MDGEFTGAELRILRRLDTPFKIQRFLDEEIGYNKELGGETCYSPRRVLRHGIAYCMEGALMAAAALRMHGRPPLIVDLEAVRDDDHVLAVYRDHGLWGAVAKSSFNFLRFREPVYRSIRELVMSYFELYFNGRREKTLRGYSRPINLARFDGIRWMTSETDLWPILDYLGDVEHVPLLVDGAERRLSRMDRLLFAAGMLGHT
jgi:hypothetical protein